MDEALLHESLLHAVNGVVGNRQVFVQALRESVLSVISGDRQATDKDCDKEIAALQKQLMELMQTGGNADEYQKICEKIDALRMQKIDSIHRKKQDSRHAEEIENRLRGLPELREYDDVLIRKLIAQIEVEKGARLEVRFRSGIVVRQGVE